jgi:hypothetical protein
MPEASVAGNDPGSPAERPSAAGGDRSGPFEWRVFADATGAGLSALIPLPLLDLAFEAFFRRNMPRTIARWRGVAVDREVAAALGQGSFDLLSGEGCLKLPLLAAFWFLKRLSRKIVYVLAVKEAAQQLSAYWHRAYLQDYLLTSGRLQRHPESAIGLFNQTLDEADTDSLGAVGRQVAGSVGSALGTLIRARRGRTEGAMDRQRALVSEQWSLMERALRLTVQHFEALDSRRSAGIRDPADGLAGGGASAGRQPTAP